jgi:hypothetical protein
VLYRAERISPFRWGRYIAIALVLEVILLIAIRLVDPWRIVAAITVVAFIWRHATVMRHYLELLLSWEHDLRYGMERNRAQPIGRPTSFRPPVTSTGSSPGSSIISQRSPPRHNHRTCGRLY